MPQPFAFMNHGRWLYRCPRCQTPIEAERDVCPRCWPGIVARAFQPIKETGLLRRVPDPEYVEQARAEAAKRGEVYKPIFPPERNDIEHILRSRAVQHMNWEPGEKIEQLLDENRQNGDEVPLKFEERKHGL